MITFGSFFSGGGMLEQGIKECGAHVEFKFAVEYDSKIADAYRANHGNHVICDDVRNVDPSKLPTVDWFHASPVCCRFTRVNALNKRMGEKYEENDLDITTAQAVVNYVQHHNPRFVTIENVAEYIGSDSYHVIVDALDVIGYTIRTDVWRDCEIGGITGRRRMIVRAAHDRGQMFPPPVMERGHGKWVDIVMPSMDPAARTLAKHNAGKIEPSIKEGRYDPSRTCFVDYRSGVHFLTCAYETMCAPGITASSFREPFMVHIGGEDAKLFHKLNGSAVWFRLHGLWHYRIDNISNAIFICGNGIPKSFVKNVMLPFVFQQGTGVIEQGVLL